MKILINETQLQKLKKIIINEQGFGDYPAGAENDSDAPWNEKDVPDSEVIDIEIVDDDVDTFDDVYVVFHNDRNGEAEYELSKILDNVDLSDDEIIYFQENIKTYPRVNDWEEKINEVAKRFVKSNDIEFYNEKEYDPNDEKDLYNLD